MAPWLSVLVVLLSVAWSRGALAGTGGGVTFPTPPFRVERYGLWEAEIRVASPAPGNPFTAGRVVSTFTHLASGRTTSVEGFCDSQDGSVYRVRFASRDLGPHSYAIRYADGVNDVQSMGGFNVTPGGLPGFLRVDPQHPRHFVTEAQGRHFFLLGHTAYHIANPVVPDENWIGYLDHIQPLGFDKVRMLLSSGRNRTFWHYRLFPWTGDIDTSTYDQYDVSLWQRFDRVVGAMADRRIYAELIFEVGTENMVDRFGGFEVPTEKELAFYRYGIARLGAYWNVLWNLGNEALEFHSQAWCNTMGNYVKSIDPYPHLLTVHGFSAFPFGGQSWADNVVVQAYSGGGAASPRDDYGSLWYVLSLVFRWAKPIVDDEFGYEQPYSPDQVRKSAWTIACSGCYSSYGSNDSLTVRTDEQELFSNEIADAWVGKIKTFFEKTDWWRLQNDQAVVLAADHSVMCLAERGSEYVVYLPDGGGVTLALDEAAGTFLPIEWIDPITLAATPANPPSTYGERRLVITAPNEAGDAILHVGKIVRNERYFDSFSHGTPPIWTQSVGTWAVVDGAYRQTDPNAPGASTTLLGRTFADFSLDVDVRIPDDPSRWAGISFRKEGPLAGYWTSGYLVLLRNDGHVDLVEATNGAFRVLGTAAAPSIVPRGWNHVSLIVRGGTIQVQVNRQRVLASTSVSPKYLSGYLSFAAERGVVEFDNVRMRPSYFEDWNDEVGDGIHELMGQFDLQNRRFTSLGSAPISLASVDFRTAGDFRATVDLEMPDVAARKYAGLLIAPKIEWPLHANGYVVALTNRGPGGAPTAVLVRAGAGGGSRVVGSYVDRQGTTIRRGLSNTLSVAIANGVVSVDVNGTNVMRFTNQAANGAGYSVGLMAGATVARFDNLVIRDER
jgi:uncharacterized protein DUF4038/3-keto-disaccharide hydrolase/uncharacterized protein DUF5060